MTVSELQHRLHITYMEIPQKAFMHDQEGNYFSFVANVAVVDSCYMIGSRKMYCALGRRGQRC